MVAISRGDKEYAVEIAAERARRHSDAFCEFVLKDEKGRNVTQAPIHREINWHIDECRRLKKNCGILAPWGHGKTEAVVIARTLQFIGEDPNNRIFIVCNQDDNAKARVASIGKYIDRDSDFKLVHPNIRPGSKEEWSKHKLVVQRQSKSKDGSIEAWGITTSGTGSRCDFLIVDDPVDLRNAILQPKLRPQVKDCFKNVWMSRLSTNGFMIYIATTWHNDDLTSELLKNSAYCFLVMKISEDFSCIECESPLKGKYIIPLWEAAWPKDKLIEKRKELGERAYNRGFRQMALSDEDKTFKSTGKVFRYGADIRDLVQPEWPRVAGMDPFGKQVVIFTLALSPQGRRYPVDIRCGKWDPTRAVNELIAAYRKHRHQMICVENNAAQETIIQWAREKGEASMPIVAFTTGSQKADPIYGLPSMEVEFENGSWICAMGRAEHEPDCDCVFCEWRRELDSHPVGVTYDKVMASWFAREAARALTLGVEQQASQAPEGEVVTMQDMGTPRVEIGANYD